MQQPDAIASRSSGDAPGGSAFSSSSAVTEAVTGPEQTALPKAVACCIIPNPLNSSGPAADDVSRVGAIHAASAIYAAGAIYTTGASDSAGTSDLS